ncbi:MAG: hypothetical protein Q4G42_01735 [Neisseria sp.]|nr:hypothetical protein [Neisseria sp.]
MNIIKILIVLVLLAFGYHWWSGKNTAENGAESNSSTGFASSGSNTKSESSSGFFSSKSKTSSPSGFVSVAMPDGARPNTVIILAPQNCPSDAAQRADALARGLTQAGIPNIRSSSYTSNIADPTTEQKAALRRAVAVMEGEIPAVFVNGMAKANPSLDEVAAEYRRTQP